MTPILYEKDEIDFTSHGLGSLVEIYDVDVQEQRNGLLQLTASYPVSGLRYADISVGRIILAKPNQRDDVHAFRIVSTELDISGYAVTVEADSITYDLTHNLVKHLNASGNGQSFMTALKNAVVNPAIFAFYSDIATSSTTSLDYVNPMEAIMGTTGSFLQIWGGELKRENRRVAMFNRRGRDNVTTFRLGKNISGLKYSVDISSLVTRIIPTKSVQNDDQTTTTLEGTPVDSQYINNYEQIYTLPLEFTDDTIKTVADLNTAAKGWFTQSANIGRDKPTVTIDIDVLSLQDSADYQDKFKNLESVSLTDTVTVYVPEYGVNVTAIVNELHYDPILDRVTKMTVGTAKQSFADSSRTQLSDLQDKIISVQNQADATAVSANGKNKNYYGSAQPSHPQEGDQWYWQDGDKSGIKQFINGEWMPLIDSNTQEQIEAGVNEAIAQANENTATAIEQNNISQQEVMNDIAKSQADLAIKDGDFNNKAQAMADEALANAKANTATVAQETLNTANENLDAAKQSLTTDLQKEISDRTTAVATLDSKAQGYADSAKQDAIVAATTADGTINKKIDETASSLTSKITQNKQDADGKITTAQSTATQALNEVKTKVSQTEYNTKTGQLTTDVNSVTQTANQSKQDIVSINQKDGQQDSRMNTIESDASGTKTTVSDIQIEQGKQSGSISILQQRADGFDASVAKINNVVNSLGQTNQLFNTEFSPDFEGWYEVDNGYELSSQVPTYDGSNVVHIKTANTDYDWLRQKIPVVPGQVLSFSTMMKFAPTSPDDSTVYWRYSINFYKSSGGSSLAITYGKQNFQALDWTLQKSENIVAPADAAYVTINYYMRGAGEAWLAKPMLVFESTVGQYVQGNYNNNDALAKVKLTAEQAALDLSNYKTDADGRISKAQTNIVATAKDVTTKVSQIDYNAKTGDLSTSVSKAQQTGDSAVTTIGNYKTSNDNRVKATETSIAQNTKDITLRATTSDLNTAKNDYNAQIAQVKVNADSITNQVSSIQTKINSMGQVNQLANTEFNPDMSGWYGSTAGASSDPIKNAIDSSHVTPLPGQGYSSSNAVLFDTTDQTSQFYARLIQYVPVTSGTSVSMSWYVKTLTYGTYTNMWITFWDKNGKNITNGSLGGTWSKGKVTNQWDYMTLPSLTNISVPDTAVTMRISMESREGIKQLMSRFMVVFDSTVGDYVPGQYNNNTAIALQQITIDGITDTVSKQGTNIDSVTKRVTTAESTLSTATNNISGLQSSVTQTSNQITQEISDRKTGDSNTLQSSKDFTTSSITGYDTGLQTQLTQTSNGIINTIGSLNMVIDSSLTNQVDHWNQRGTGKWYYTSATSYQGITSWGFNQTSLNGDYSHAESQPIYVNTFPGNSLYVSVDVKVPSIGGTSTDYFIVYVREYDSSGEAVTNHTITGTLGSVVSNWTNYRKNITLNSNTNYIVLSYQMRGNGNVYVSRPYIGIQELMPGAYVPGQVDNNQTILSLFKDNWSIGITDNIGAITSGIVGNSSSMSLISKNITLDGNTTVTGDFYAKGGNFKNLNASNITVGTLNGNQVNITNLNASNIVSGAISGANLNINLNTGQVQFQKGRIFKSDYTTDINIDQGYISTADSNTRVLLKSGQMQFVAPNVFDLQNTPYLKVYNGTGGNSFAGANLSGRDYIALYNSANSSNVFDAPIGTESFSGISTGQASTDKWAPTKVGGANRGVIISGGRTDGWLIVERSPYIFVGSDASGTSAYGNRVYVHADYFQVPTVYSHSGSTGANVYVASDGALVKSSSATKYKTNIEHETDGIQGDQLLTIDPATWNDKFESEQLEHYHETGVEPERQINMEGKRYYGIIAEDLVKAGLEELVTRNEETDEVEGVEYSKIGVALIPIVRDLRNKLNEQAVEIERLKDKIK